MIFSQLMMLVSGAEDDRDLATKYRLAILNGEARRRYGTFEMSHHAVYDVGTGYLYNQLPDVPKSDIENDQSLLGEGYPKDRNDDTGEERLGWFKWVMDPAVGTSYTSSAKVESSPRLGEQGRLGPMGRRRNALDEPYWYDVGTGHAYSQRAKVGKSPEDGDTWVKDPATGRGFTSRAQLNQNLLGEGYPMDGYDNQEENFKLGEQGRLWPMGRRRYGFNTEYRRHAIYDVGTGFIYNQITDLPKTAENVHGQSLGEGYPMDGYNRQQEENYKLGEQGRLWPMGRRRYGVFSHWNAYVDVGKGYLYNQLQRVPKNAENVHGQSLGEGYSALIPQGRPLAERLYRNSNVGRRRVEIWLEPLAEIPDELAPNVRTICEDGPGILSIDGENALSDPDLKDEDRAYVEEQMAAGENDFMSETPFECMHDKEEFSVRKEQRESEGYTPKFLTAAEDSGQLTELKKIGDVHELCHLAAARGSADEKRLCHIPHNAAIYETTTDSTPEHKFQIVCHDKHPEDPEWDLVCHPVRTGDAAFLKTE